MIKIVLMLRKRADLSREQFIDYYENHHVPLVMSLIGDYFADYKRNYIRWDNPVSAHAAPDFVAANGEQQFDVVTECWFKDEATMMECFDKSQNSDIAETIASDEENCFDRSSIRSLIVDEYPA
jgi:hypothetical protein